MVDNVLDKNKLGLVTVGLRARVLGLRLIFDCRSVLVLQSLAWRYKLGVVAIWATKIAAAQKTRGRDSFWEIN